MRGRKSELVIELTPEERHVLHSMANSTTLPARTVWRARAVLMRALGWTITDIAATAGLSRLHIYKWLRRYQDEGWQGLSNRQRGHKAAGRAAHVREARAATERKEGMWA